MVKRQYTTVKYEDFTRNPESILDDILKFCRLTPYDYYSDLKSIKIVNRNKENTDYFTNEQLGRIFQIIDDSFLE